MHAYAGRQFVPLLWWSLVWPGREANSQPTVREADTLPTEPTRHGRKSINFQWPQQQDSEHSMMTCIWLYGFWFADPNSNGKITLWFLNQCLSMTYSYIPWLSMTHSYIPWLSMTWFQNQVLSSAGLCISGILWLFRFSITRMNTDLPAQLSIQLNVFHHHHLVSGGEITHYSVAWYD